MITSFCWKFDFTVPCAPESIAIEEDEPGNLTVSWSEVDLGDYYVAFVKSDDGLEVHCNTSRTQCHFQSDCGFTYFISVFAYNKAGQSPLGDIFNYTTGKYQFIYTYFHKINIFCLFYSFFLFPVLVVPKLVGRNPLGETEMGQFSLRRAAHK